MSTASSLGLASDPAAMSSGLLHAKIQYSKVQQDTPSWSYRPWAGWSAQGALWTPGAATPGQALDYGFAAEPRPPAGPV